MATLLWAWQDGTALDDAFNTVAMGSDGSSVLTGFNNKNETGWTAVWMAVKLDADGAILWTWQDDTTGDENDLVYAAVMGEDGSVVMAGSAGDDFQVIKLEADGSLGWRFEDSTGIWFTDSADGIAMGEDASVVVVGGTGGTWNIPNIGDWDMAAFKLDADGTLLWKWQDGTVGIDYATDVAMADDGSVVMVGKSNGDLTDVNTSVSGYSSSFYVADQYNFVAIKLDSEGAEVWRWQDGPRGEFNSLYSVATTDDGSFVMVGRCDGFWSRESAGELDFAAVKLDADGNELWRWQDGTLGYDSLYASVVRTDGTIVLGGYTQGDWIGSNAGGIDFAIVALDADGEEIWRWQDGSAAFGDISGDDSIHEISADSDGRVLFVGQTLGSYAAVNLGGGDYVAVMLNTNALDSLSPTTAPPSSAAPLSSPTPTASPPPAAGQISSPAPTPSSSSAATPATRATPSAPTPAPSPASLLATSSGTTQGASNVVPIAAGVASAVAGAAVIAFVFCLLKRNKDTKSGTAQEVHPPLAAIDRGNDPTTLRQNTAPPPPPYMHPVAARQEATAPSPPPYLHAITIPQEDLEPPPPPYQHAVAPAAAYVSGGGKDYF